MLVILGRKKAHYTLVTLVVDQQASPCCERFKEIELTNVFVSSVLLYVSYSSSLSLFQRRPQTSSLVGPIREGKTNHLWTVWPNSMSKNAQLQPWLALTLIQLWFLIPSFSMHARQTDWLHWFYDSSSRYTFAFIPHCQALNDSNREDYSSFCYRKGNWKCVTLMLRDHLSPGCTYMYMELRWYVSFHLLMWSTSQTVSTVHAWEKHVCYEHDLNFHHLGRGLHLPYNAIAHGFW